MTTSPWTLETLTTAQLTQLTPIDPFDPILRRRAIWSTDARKIALGKSDEVYAEKTGLMERQDLSDNEAAQWGLKLQDIIGREVGHRLKMELKEADYQLTHPKHHWMKSHFDFISYDGKTLVEVKNYHASKRNKFDTRMMPIDDRAQCVHEAAVHGVSRVILAVLFGGQELHTIDSEILEAEKDELIQTEAELWAAINAKSPPSASSPETARILWPQSSLGHVVANARLEQMCAALKAIKDNISKLEKQEKEYTSAIQSAMQANGSLVTIDGTVLATWHTAKSSKTFNRELFQQLHPTMYESFVRETPGSRRFLLK